MPRRWLAEEVSPRPAATVHDDVLRAEASRATVAMQTASRPCGYAAAQMSAISTLPGTNSEGFTATAVVGSAGEPVRYAAAACAA